MERNCGTASRKAELPNRCGDRRFPPRQFFIPHHRSPEGFMCVNRLLRSKHYAEASPRARPLVHMGKFAGNFYCDRQYLHVRR